MSSRNITIGSIIFAVVLFVLANAAFIVSQTEQALVLQFGKPIREISKPGLHFKTPFMQNVEYYDKRLLDFYVEEKEVIAADQKRMIVDAFVRYRITSPLEFKKAVGTERTMRSRLNAMLESALRQVIGSIPLADVVSEKRAGLMRRIQDLVNKQAQGGKLDENGNIIQGGTNFGIEVVDARIMRADLPETNSQSIYRRMQTEREQEAREFRAQGEEDAQKIRAQAEKERTIILAEAKKSAEQLRGQGDREALQIVNKAVGKDHEFYQFYRTMQAYRKALGKDDTTMILSPDGDFLKYLERKE